jgi:hypothetical protein
MMTRYRQNMAAVWAVGLALCVAAPAEAAKAAKKKPAPAAHAAQHRHAAAARHGFRYQGGVPAGPLYNGQDYIGNVPDPNIRSYLIRDMTRYGGPE